MSHLGGEYRSRCHITSSDSLHHTTSIARTAKRDSIQFPNGFLPPVPLISIGIPTWDAFDPFTQQSLSFSDMLLTLSMDFDNDCTVDLTVTSTADDMFESALDNNDSSLFSNMITTDGADLPHEELHWKLMLRDDSLDWNQKKSLKLTLLTSPWGHPIKLAKYLYVGHILIGTPTNPFSMREAECRHLITTSLLKALHLDLKTYKEIHEIPCECPSLTTEVINLQWSVTVVNSLRSETRIYWSQLRTRVSFSCSTTLTYYWSFRAVLRSPHRFYFRAEENCEGWDNSRCWIWGQHRAGGWNKTSHHWFDELWWRKYGKRLHIAQLFFWHFHPLDSRSYLQAYSHSRVLGNPLGCIIQTHCWLSSKPSTIGGSLPQSHPNLDGLSRKGYHGHTCYSCKFSSRICLIINDFSYQMYQSFIPSHTEKTNLKTLELYPRIMAALDVMYAHPHRFDTFFDAVLKLPHIWSVS